jgi:hypothetical protein
VYGRCHDKIPPERLVVLAEIFVGILHSIQKTAVIFLQIIQFHSLSVSFVSSSDSTLKNCVIVILITGIKIVECNE